MSNIKPLLDLREKMKEKKPDFIRQDPHKKRLRKRWVKPRGLHSKVRLKKKGHPKKVSDGYRAPREVRGLSRQGLKIKIVHNENDLGMVSKEKEGVIIASNVGLKNKILLMRKAKESGIKILNLNVDEYLKVKEEGIKERLEKKKAKEKEKKKKKEKEEEKKLEEKLDEEEKKKQGKEEKVSEEEKKKQEKREKKSSLSQAELEKKEKDKFLTKRDV
ncbi:hypothetical protein KY366_00765 [Candidatus Woesearchaeota archaeon]|nr:hypothetical protein [Candidatus Woesearchaeota archaeon]